MCSFIISYTSEVSEVTRRIFDYNSHYPQSTLLRAIQMDLKFSILMFLHVENTL